MEKSVNAVVGGVGMLLRDCAKKSRNSIENIQPRMTYISFNGNPCTTIISCYSPINDSDGADIITIY